VELQNVSDIDEGDIVSIRLDKGIVINHTKDQTFFIKPFPRFLLKIIRSGGLMEYAKREYGGRT
jgi:3-isopropylmalate/(R)-2-methylmalate dehydratase small subunit